MSYPTSSLLRLNSYKGEVFKRGSKVSTSPTKSTRPHAGPTCPIRPRHRSARSKRLEQAIFISNFILILIAFGFFTVGIVVAAAEDKYLGQFDIHLARNHIVVHHLVGAVNIMAAIIGILAHFKGNKPTYFAAFCAILGIMAFVQLALGAGVVNLSTNTRVMAVELRSRVMESYPQLGENHDKNKNNYHRRFDRFQRDLHCCGLRNFTEWQFVRFGRTSLNVPRTCCVGKRLVDMWCGINQLPPREDAGNYIYTQGCFSIFIGDYVSKLRSSGAFNIVVGFAQISFATFVGYMLVTKKL